VLRGSGQLSVEQYDSAGLSLESEREIAKQVPLEWKLGAPLVISACDNFFSLLLLRDANSWASPVHLSQCVLPSTTVSFVEVRSSIKDAFEETIHINLPWRAPPQRVIRIQTTLIKVRRSRCHWHQKSLF
jgi:hypothetical protein